MADADVFSAAGLPPREQVTEWANIKKTVGDKVSGTFLGWWIKPADTPGFRDQIGIAMKRADGVVVGISVSDTPYMRERVQGSEMGDEVGLKYEGDKDTGKPQPAKIIKFYNPALEARRAKGLVKVSAPEVLGGSATTPAADAADDEGPGF